MISEELPPPTIALANWFTLEPSKEYSIIAAILQASRSEKSLDRLIYNPDELSASDIVSLGYLNYAAFLFRFVTPVSLLPIRTHCEEPFLDIYHRLKSENLILTCFAEC
jgi:hypothetical protein